MSLWDGIFDTAKDAVLDSVPGGSLVGNLLGGTSGSTPVRCPDQPSDDAVAYALSRAPESVKTRGRTLFRAAGLESKFSTPYSIAYESLGGNHCNWDASSVAMQMHDWFINDLMGQYGQGGPDVGYEGNYSSSFDGSTYGAADNVPQVQQSFVSSDKRSGPPGWVMVLGVIGLVVIAFALYKSR